MLTVSPVHVINIWDHNVFAVEKKYSRRRERIRAEFGSVSFPSCRCQNKITKRAEKGQNHSINVLKCVKTWLVSPCSPQGGEPKGENKSFCTVSGTSCSCFASPTFSQILITKVIGTKQNIISFFFETFKGVKVIFFFFLVADRENKIFPFYLRSSLCREWSRSLHSEFLISQRRVWPT